MSITDKYSFYPFNLDPDFISNIRDILSSSEFSSEGITNHLRGNDPICVEPKSLPRLLKMTAEDVPIHTFIRLFILGVNVPKEVVQKAILPMSLESWCEGGVLCENNGKVNSPLQLLPHNTMLVAFDRPTLHAEDEAAPDHVHGMGGVSLTLLNATIRKNFDRVLDLGTGCGIQGLLSSEHSSEVISTDVNPRALNIASFNSALNEIENQKILEGSLFEPVREETFDLITMNPPFAISPDNKFVFRDGGLGGDHFVQKIIHEGPDYLKENGFLQITAQWAHFSGQSWQDRLSDWVKASGCDVWIIKLKTQSIEAYAENWISETEKHDPKSYQHRWNQWMEYFKARQIEAVSTGIITMRRTRVRSNWYWTNEGIDHIDAFGGEVIAKGFVLRDFLFGLKDPSELILEKLKVSPHTIFEHHLNSEGEGWTSGDSILRINHGLHYRGQVDANLADLLGQCNGQRTLKSLIEHLASSVNTKPENIAPSILKIIYNLIERGFVQPDSFRCPV